MGRPADTDLRRHWALPPPGLAVQADALRAAFPDYQVIVTSAGGEHRIEVVRQRGEGGPWCLISTDAREIWQELTTGS
jgi:hypothetical protein